MCNRINLQTTQEKQLLFMVCGMLFFFLNRNPDKVAPTNATLNASTSTDVKLKAQVLIRGDNVWQRHYLA